MNNDELILTQGGGWSASMFNYAIQAFKTIVDFGRQVGSTLRRLIGGKLCSL